MFIDNCGIKTHETGSKTAIHGLIVIVPGRASVNKTGHARVFSHLVQWQIRIDLVHNQIFREITRISE
jgi:hypothetical protein